MIGKPLCLQEGKIKVQQIRALKALEAGEAGPYEQQLALKTIVDNFCGTYQRSFLPGQPNESTFMQGRQYPGQRIFHYLNIDPTELRKLEEEEKKPNA